MKAGELFERALLGEKTAYEKWSLLNHEPIARFGYQNGITAPRLQKFLLDVFRQLHSQLPADYRDEQEAETALYKIAVSHLPAHCTKEQGSDDKQILRFEEDREIHLLIQELDEEVRIPLVLFYFHNKSIDELGDLLELPSHLVDNSIKEAIVTLQGKMHLQNREQVEKRLEFLGASYSRFTPSFNEEELFAEQETETSIEKAAVEPKAPVQKRTVAVIGLSSLFLLGVIGASFAMNDDNVETTAAAVEDGEINKATVKAWKAEYKKIKESSPERLGITPKVYEKLEFVQRADEKFEKTLKKSNIKKFEDDPEALREQVAKLMLAIETPKGMLETLNQTTMEESETAEFMQSFALKTKELMGLADAVLLEHEDALSNAFSHGEFSAESIRVHKEKYPKEVGALVDSLNESMLFIQPHPTEKRFLTRRNMELFYSNQLYMQDIFGYQYIALLEGEPYFDEEDLLLPVEEMAFHLTQIERYLVDAAKNSNKAFDEFEEIFYQAFWLTLKGSEANPVFGSDGVVKENYQEAWNNLISDAANPLVFVMLPIIEEMEASGWRKSAHYDALAYPDISAALKMEQNGELAAKLPNGDVKIKPAFVDMKDFSYDQTKKLYSKFAANHDKSILKDVPPLDVLFMYHYANKIKDSETMWHLLAEDKLKPSIKEYKKEWKQQPDITEEALWVEVYGDSLYRRKDELYLEPMINYQTENGRMPPSTVLVTKRDHIWLVKNQMYEAYSLGGKEKEYENLIASLYQAFSAKQEEAILESASPGEIAGVFLKAAEEEDYTTMYALLEEPAKTISLESFRHQVVTLDIPDFSSLKNLIFTLDMYEYEDDQRRGHVQLDFGSGSPESYEFYDFGIVETAKGWRMSDMNAY
ncbi:hypothetical protein [Planococcus shixiaomingii]|uniref:hypothetical protein n=1 Tax=Planococcus shixiaomingii TaxID=3058393 RepID=UPI00260C6092|nr:hypothetical protein [Planococcus sp. N022]WKA56054.1 hypothetical protein QWY21_06720 [Planococcus sp. N022]